MSIALGARQHALELLDERLSLLRVGPAQQLLGFRPRQLAAGEDHAGRLAAAQQAEAPAPPPRPAAPRPTRRGVRPLPGGGGRPALGPAGPPPRARLPPWGKKGGRAPGGGPAQPPPRTWAPRWGKKGAGDRRCGGT